MSWVTTVPPATEPVTLDEAKLHLRVESSVTSDDTLITALIQAAREYVENRTGRGLITQTRECYFDSYPGERIAGYWWDRFPVHIRRAYFQPLSTEEIRLPGAPFQSLTSISYTDTAGATQTLDPSYYVVDDSVEPVRLALAYGKAWPATLAQANSVSATYIIGYGTASAVPESIKAAMKLIIGDLYDSRSASLNAKVYENPAVEAILFPYVLTHIAGESG